MARWMIIILPVFAVQGFSGVRSYIRASDQYLKSRTHWRRMLFSFPEVCPICTRPGCVEWKGYYVRGIQDIVHGCQRIVIRRGGCRYHKIRFSLLPDFLMPRLRLTRRTVEALLSAARGRGVTLQAAIDTCISPWHERNYIAVATAHVAIRRHAFEAWWANTHEHREVLRVSLKCPRQVSTPQSFRSETNFVTAFYRGTASQLLPITRMRDPPAVPAYQPNRNSSFVRARSISCYEFHGAVCPWPTYSLEF
jgi:hypothetical protein